VTAGEENSRATTPSLKVGWTTFGPGGIAPTNPVSAEFTTYYANYHGSYEPPFCHLQARTLFNTVR
jgi:hypothetical protein